MLSVKRAKRGRIFGESVARGNALQPESFVTSKLSNYSERVEAKWREREREREREKEEERVYKRECIATRRVLQFAAVIVADVIYEAIIRGPWLN